ncbi:MAG TPA: hypothetical protein VGJ22_04375 [Anaerolineales bacterium]
MAEETTYTLSQAHYHFAVDYHGKTWELLDKPERTAEENQRMLDYAHASLAHWRTAGAAVRYQRGEWMLARVYAVLGSGALALEHAHRCAEILEQNKTEMEDFDLPFAYEAVARAYAISGNAAEAKKFLALAKKEGEAIQGNEDREIFFKELGSGNWNGVK